MSGNLTAPPAPSPATLQANLTAAQAAYQALITGALVAEATYSEGTGTRTVRYTAARLGELTNYIALLQTQMGYRGRKAIGIRF